MGYKPWVIKACVWYFNQGKNELCIFKALSSNKSPTYSTEQKKNASIMVLTVHAVAVKKSIQRMNAFFFSRHVPTLVNNFYDNKKLQFFISDFSLPRVTQAAAKCTVLYYYLFFAFFEFFIKLLTLYFLFLNNFT